MVELYLIAGATLAFILTLMIFTFIWRDNAIYRFAEHTYLAVALGHYFNLSLYYLRDNTLPSIGKGRIILIVPLILGFLYFTRYIKNRVISSLSRLPVGVLTGIVTAVLVTAALDANLVRNMAANLTVSLQPTYANLTNWIVLIGSLVVLTYFIFIREHTGVLLIPSRLGLYVMMIALAGWWAGAVMTRLGGLFPVIKDVLIGYILKLMGRIPW